jgi:hypothetical protein
MKTIKRLAPWITRLEQALEGALFAAATLVIAAGTLVMVLRPVMALA